MPTYSYKCKDCGIRYDVFHKSVNNQDEVVCPECSSSRSIKVVTSANFSGLSVISPSYDRQPMNECSTGTCSSGMCGLN